MTPSSQREAADQESDQSGPAPRLPSFAQNLSWAFAQKGLTTFATSLMTLAAAYKLIPKDAIADWAIVLIGVVSILAYAGGCVWTWLHERKRTDTAKQALAANPPPS